MAVKRYFSIEEANQLLPQIQDQLVKLFEIKQTFNHLNAQLQQLKNEAELEEVEDEVDDPFFNMEAKIDFLQIEAQTHIDNIHNQGVQLKDLDVGLIDFPAIHDGEDILLCWKLGEDLHIRYYHGVVEGFIGRKPIEDIQNDDVDQEKRGDNNDSSTL